MIQAGRLRHRITIQSPSYLQDNATGDMTPIWTTVATVWGAIEPLSAREFIAAQAEQSKITGKIVIRYRDDLTPDMRILHGSKIYNPHGFLTDIDSGREYMTIPCSEGVSLEDIEEILIIDGGVPDSDFLDFIDGGIPSSEYTLSFDGGTP